MKSKRPSAPKKPTVAAGPGRKERRYKCNVCGERFLSRLELRAHKQKYKGPHKRPKGREEKSEGIVNKIEEIRSQEYHGYRETDRSS